VGWELHSWSCPSASMKEREVGWNKKWGGNCTPADEETRGGGRGWAASCQPGHTRAGATRAQSTHPGQLAQPAELEPCALRWPSLRHWHPHAPAWGADSCLGGRSGAQLPLLRFSSSATHTRSTWGWTPCVFSSSSSCGSAQTG